MEGKIEREVLYRFNCSFGGVLHNAFIRTFGMLSMIFFLILLKLVLVKGQVEKKFLDCGF